MTSNHNDKTRVILVTGPSGGGHTTAIHALEDIGFEAIDNMPLALIPRLIEGPQLQRPLVLSIGTRTRDFSTTQLVEAIALLTQNPSVDLHTLYLGCSVDVLLRRYSETRRKHHLSPSETALHGIERDLELMQSVKSFADIVIDTSTLTPHQLRHEVTRWFLPETRDQMAISVQSFSYKRGLPRNVDMMFDCRFLRNPYWDAGLRVMNGQDAAVQSYVQADARFVPFRDQVMGLIDLVIPAHLEEGRSHLTIAFGCTGGQHRSVTMAETVQKQLLQKGWHVTIRHRELDAKAQQIKG